ncbi:MAG: NAD(P)-dependent alcohol dehydrogenase [Gammaproteobacteria bacterium]|jgi:NADPH:quinone reductase-like Zn-dependent oxidoreductase|nr:NAD(P)-dependent alcohol dehydrogenase [Gammaproteobacteria bacterium]MBU0769868.1 NAD(P)-dependent alcohol dehydrogenase [Gammaproteobacteria bacterium]MBU0854673.1 NAD(P)-dependent alcohol dehydrogenase [Gammaproteobacteria bacterium]MBU1845953.1 NAD(P)-dependent alcohol dehydrogenase [Gammaproteobacteria bacterium]
MRSQVYLEHANIDSLSVVERDIPRPGPGQVLVRMRAASLNYRDYLIVTDRYPGMISKDLVPLSDGAGEVVDTGPDTSRFATGDRVIGCFFEGWLSGPMLESHYGASLGGTASGVLSEYRVFDENALVALPEHLSFEQGATLPCAALTAWNALFEGPRPLRPGDTVLVLGTGGVSMFALQFAQAAGAEVIATSSSDTKLEKVRALGATKLINYRTHPDWEQQVLEMTGGRGVDHVVEVGGPGTLQRSISAARHGGSVHLIGVLTGGQIDPLAILFRSTQLRGVFVGSRDMFESMNRLLAARKIEPVIDRVFGFTEARAAIRHLEGATHFGKVVIRID